MRSFLAALVVTMTLTGCFGSRQQQQRYYVLFMAPAQSGLGAVIPGLARVRNLDSETTYDKFQIVVRRNPYELSYSKGDVWAVKPNRMISDLLARRLQEYGLFSSVSRELGERRPDYSLGGDLHAVELYDSGDKQ
ncbi:MAG: ABC-type transport auxiliary lipoprotein family protein [Myxococcota bacterium]